MTLAENIIANNIVRYSNRGEHESLVSFTPAGSDDARDEYVFLDPEVDQIERELIHGERWLMMFVDPGFSPEDRPRPSAGARFVIEGKPALVTEVMPAGNGEYLVKVTVGQ